ncbi:hypothetical protein CANTEDRAFT_113350 [Yamadazyma tenuis ATCC 10573]|uniref:N-acetylglucosamine-6-phosphate deacetylase n=2 Tax=Candida tenuis TaxID=2315449 RepID=G3B218_CANTC|nr:Metallo-dependent hydrolase [Yamadazyma tenuis ATCC 10573]XP_006685840.1 uncharacterized protein CANTEDRAFT_113350 [Yamadazyma tenuis ATCC 10573]EGV65033.1 Metallo-dependent hydrolase [Yamadazyma tenuis ATCC 10573]EGV65034.1 hypothetical protein CANTEDRAFT_113350 [Yamadazyma tenuis ATCC 10573]
MRYTKFTNCHLLDNGITYYNTDLYVDNHTGKITGNPQDTSNTNTVDLDGNFLAPGLIDIQNNGFFGHNFSNLNAGSTPEQIEMFKRFYEDVMTKFLETGVTSVCPTVTSNFPEVYTKVLPLYKRSRSNDKCDSLGAHCEGPFISLIKKGCHPTETFVDAKEGSSKLDQVYGADNLLENVCIVTAAPEIDGVLDVIPYLRSKNVIYSIGHTNADYETGLKAVENGCTMITHLYNAMPQPHHRDAGVLGLINNPITDNTPYFGIICDGIHVDPSMAAMAYKSHPDKCVLVTDAIFLFGLPDGTYRWDSRNVVKDGFKLMLEGTKTLAGSGTSLIQCVRNVIRWTDISLAEAVKAATNNPAKSLGIESEKGFLNEGCDADLVVLNNRAFIQSIYKLGRHIKVNDHNQPAKLISSL